ncbi:MAG: DKNYY domain-containing protein [Myroides sp.]
MKEKIKNILLLLFISCFFSSCNFGYKKENGKVFYKYWNAGMGISTRTFEIIDVDFETFEEIEFDSDCSFKFARDKNNLYIDGHKYNDVDPKTFKYIGNYIFADKDSAYFFGFYNNFNDCSIKNINPNKIELLKYPWAKSGNYLINGKSTIYLNDINDFTPIDDDWGKTKTKIINCNKILYDAHVESFEVISSYEGKDKYFNYEFGAIKNDDFKRESFTAFSFYNKDLCKTISVQFDDIYNELVSYNQDKKNPIKIIEKLKELNFQIIDTKEVDWIGDSKIIRVNLKNDNCDCIVEKLYRIDYSISSEYENRFKVTERFYCK